MDLTLIVALLAFALVALASRQIGAGFSRIGLPLITGYLFCGMVAGPYLLGLISRDTVIQLRFV
ncbi:MAG: hypothetical protein GF355_09380, partial [Candidatus Eisenbacteria bacterium]|nr:hypothetical protein [Candidatus Eisenbacteria bacterium]